MDRWQLFSAYACSYTIVDCGYDGTENSSSDKERITASTKITGAENGHHNGAINGELLKITVTNTQFRGNVEYRTTK
jgi:hypothetical protein